MKVLNSNLHTISGLPHVVKPIIINICQLEKNVKKCYNIGFAAIKMIFFVWLYNKFWGTHKICKYPIYKGAIDSLIINKQANK